MAKLPFFAVTLAALLAFAPTGECEASPANVKIKSITVMHDGRSVYIEAEAADPGAYGAVDWVPGYLDGHLAFLDISRGGSPLTIQIIFTGAVVRVEGGKLTWEAYALIPDAPNAVRLGDTLSAVSIPSGWLEDSTGNSLVNSGGFTTANYSLVGSDGFLDEGQFTFDNTLYVDLSLDTTNDYDGDNPTAWSRGQHPSTPLAHVHRAVNLYNTYSSGSSCAIRVKRGTSGAETFDSLPLNRAGNSLTSPLLFSTYDSGTRPTITFDVNMSGDPRSGFNRPALIGGVPVRGGYIYFNGLHLQQVSTSPDAFGPVGIAFDSDDNHVVISDCVIEGFSNNITFDNHQVWNYSSPHSLTQSKYWSIFRNIIIDSHSDSANPQGLFIDGAQGGLAISQNVFDHNGWSFDGTNRNTFQHNIYISGGTIPSARAHAPFVWGNFIGEGGGFGCKIVTGGVIYGNLFAENALGADICATNAAGGGRIARNYFEREKDLTEGGSGTERGWGPGVGESDAPYGPSIMELNCVVNSLGTQPFGPRVELFDPDIPDPGFESGDFGDWTQTGATSGNGIDTSAPHSGTYDAIFGADTGSGISRTVHAYSGAPVHVEFYLYQSGGTPNSALVKLGATTLLSLSNDTATTGWTLFSYDTTAPSDDPALTLSFTHGPGLWHLDDVHAFAIPPDLATDPEVVVRNNTTRGTGPFAPYMGPLIYPTITATRNSWDSRASLTGHDYAMWINGWSAMLSSITFQYNLYKSGTSNCVLENLSTSAETLGTWQYNSGQDGGSSTPSGSDPSYAYTSADYDVGNLAVHYGFSSTHNIAAYYSAIRGRGLGDNTANKIDFLGATAYMMGQYEVTSPTISGGAMPFYGSGDGSDPQGP